METQSPAPAPAPALPDFVPVPRQIVRHGGWSAERQREFIAALADTGSVPTACRMVNMAKSRAYALRREPGAEGFRRAWDAALDLGLQVLKDEAFDRALNGQLVPVFVGGKLIGYQRKKNDALLMFCLRHYGVDANGRRVTINYFSSKSSAGASAGVAAGAADEGTETTPGGSVTVPLPPERRAGGRRKAPAATAAQAEASHTTMRTVITGPAAGDTGMRDDEAAAAIAAFEGVELDDVAQAAILAALEACAVRARAAPPEEDEEAVFVPAEEASRAFVGTLEPDFACEDDAPADELCWQSLGDTEKLAEIDAAVARIEAAKAGTPLPPPPPPRWTPERAVDRVCRASDRLWADRAPDAPRARLRPDIAAALQRTTYEGGPTIIERMRARTAARRVLRAGEMEETADALAIWQAGETEAAWAVWTGGGTPAATVAVPAVRLGDDGRLLSEAALLAKGDLLVPHAAESDRRAARQAGGGRSKRPPPPA